MRPMIWCVHVQGGRMAGSTRRKGIFVVHGNSEDR